MRTPRRGGRRAERYLGKQDYDGERAVLHVGQFSSVRCPVSVSRNGKQIYCVTRFRPGVRNVLNIRISLGKMGLVDWVRGRDGPDLSPGRSAVARVEE